MADTHVRMPAEWADVASQQGLTMQQFILRAVSKHLLGAVLPQDFVPAAREVMSQMEESLLEEDLPTASKRLAQLRKLTSSMEQTLV